MSNASEPSLHADSDHQSGEQSSPEEDAAIAEIIETEEEYESPNVEECLCSFFDQPHVSRTTLEEYHQAQLKETPLFANVLILDQDDNEVCIERPSDDPSTSILVTGFGLRNFKSLQDALKIEERKR